MVEKIYAFIRIWYGTYGLNSAIDLLDKLGSRCVPLYDIENVSNVCGEYQKKRRQARDFLTFILNYIG